jgi:hypothetical protein
MCEPVVIFHTFFHSNNPQDSEYGIFDALVLAGCGEEIAAFTIVQPRGFDAAGLSNFEPRSVYTQTTSKVGAVEIANF